MVDHSKELVQPTEKDTISPSRRALLKASWVVPVVVAINLPTSSFAQNVSGGQVQQICNEAGLQCTPEQQNIILQILQRLFGG